MSSKSHLGGGFEHTKSHIGKHLGFLLFLRLERYFFFQPQSVECFELAKSETKHHEVKMKCQLPRIIAAEPRQLCAR